MTGTKRIPVHNKGQVRYFEMPEREPRPATISRVEHSEIAGYDDLYPQTARSEIQIRTSYRDRAEGFNIAIRYLALLMGVLSVIVAVMGIGVPFFDIAVVAWFGTAFCITWLIGWIFNQLVSPDGATLLSALLGYRLIRHEQKERHKYYRGE